MSHLVHYLGHTIVTTWATILFWEVLNQHAIARPLTHWTKKGVRTLGEGPLLSVFKHADIDRIQHNDMIIDVSYIVE